MFLAVSTGGASLMFLDVFLLNYLNIVAAMDVHSLCEKKNPLNTAIKINKLEWYMCGGPGT